jgi:DNA-binding MarR family transcriptional regulator
LPIATIFVAIATNPKFRIRSLSWRPICSTIVLDLPKDEIAARRKSPIPALRKRFQRLASYRLHKLASLSDRFVELRYRRKFGLRIPEVGIMAVVGASSPLSFKMTCVESDLEKSKVSRVVAQLLEKGLLNKHEDPADQRSFYLTLTAAGKKLYWAMYGDAVARNEQWIAVLPKKQRAQFLASLDRLTQHSQKLLEKERKAGAGARQTRQV